MPLMIDLFRYIKTIWRKLNSLLYFEPILGTRFSDFWRRNNSTDFQLVEPWKSNAQKQNLKCQHKLLNPKHWTWGQSLRTKHLTSFVVTLSARLLQCQSTVVKLYRCIVIVFLYRFLPLDSLLLDPSRLRRDFWEVGITEGLFR